MATGFCLKVQGLAIPEDDLGRMRTGFHSSVPFTAHGGNGQFLIFFARATGHPAPFNECALYVPS
ncbi:MAG: hypothetical protein R2787_05970 [Saprospiraceae bacterium]|nr:hypothetical protein [Saprospiraceae bacterium]MCB9312405.1 hypothetical protein [Lewinellaceae bacterium]HRW75650.1 hypothetical protein [Saprospiraceae bacterium]